MYIAIIITALIISIFIDSLNKIRKELKEITNLLNELLDKIKN